MFIVIVYPIIALMLIYNGIKAVRCKTPVGFLGSGYADGCRNIPNVKGYNTAIGILYIVSGLVLGFAVIAFVLKAPLKFIVFSPVVIVLILLFGYFIIEDRFVK
jgi:hypothetical protein